MEPRPLSRPQRPSTPSPAPAPSLPPADRGVWVPPSPAPAPSYVPPAPPVESTFAAPASPYEPASSRGAWFEPASAGGPPVQPPGYSPGPALTPIDGGRGARFLGPVLALIVLAAIVAGIVYLAASYLGDGDNNGGNNNLAANLSPTSQAVNAPTGDASPGSTAEPTETVAGSEPTQATGDDEAPAGETPEATATEQPAATEQANAPASARSMLPTTGDVPAGFQRTEDDKRAKEAVAASFSNSEEALANLNEWQWRENAYRTFALPEGEGDQSGMTFVNVSIHRFGSEQGAKDALDYFANDVIGTQSLEEFDVDRIGEQTRALRGAPDGANLVVLYIRVDNYLIRIGGSSPQGDPTDQVIAMAEQIAG